MFPGDNSSLSVLTMALVCALDEDIFHRCSVGKQRPQHMIHTIFINVRAISGSLSPVWKHLSPFIQLCASGPVRASCNYCAVRHSVKEIKAPCCGFTYKLRFVFFIKMYISVLDVYESHVQFLDVDLLQNPSRG